MHTILSGVGYRGTRKRQTIAKDVNITTTRGDDGIRYREQYCVYGCRRRSSATRNRRMDDPWSICNTTTRTSTVKTMDKLTGTKSCSVGAKGVYGNSQSRWVEHSRVRLDTNVPSVKRGKISHFNL